MQPEPQPAASAVCECFSPLNGRTGLDFDCLIRCETCYTRAHETLAAEHPVKPFRRGDYPNLVLDASDELPADRHPVVEYGGHIMWIDPAYHRPGGPVDLQYAQIDHDSGEIWCVSGDVEWSGDDMVDLDTSIEERLRTHMGLPASLPRQPDPKPAPDSSS